MRCKIVDPNALTIPDILDGLRYCRIHQLEARKYAVTSREDMMVNNLANANARNDRAKVSAIKRIMNTESGKRDWRVINIIVDDPRPPPLTSIGRMEGGVEVRYNTEEEVLRVMED